MRLISYLVVSSTCLCVGRLCRSICQRKGQRKGPRRVRSMDLDLARKTWELLEHFSEKIERKTMVLHNYIRMQAFVVDIVANTHTEKNQIRSDSLSRGACLTCRAPIDGGADWKRMVYCFKKKFFQQDRWSPGWRMLKVGGDKTLTFKRPMQLQLMKVLGVFASVWFYFNCFVL